MKKILLILAVSFLTMTTTTAQKFAYVDTDYILNKIPDFRQAQDKLDAISSDWQKDIENKYADVEQMYRAYQQEQVLLTNEMKTKREEAIINKENDAKFTTKILWTRRRFVCKKARTNKTYSG